MKKYTLRDGSTGDAIDKANEIAAAGGGAIDSFNMITGKSYSSKDLVNTAKNYMDGSGIGKGTTKPPGTEAPATETTDLTKHAVPVAVGGATTLGIKYGLKKGWGMALAGGVVTGGIAHYLKNKQETV
jgi:hypothetical protein